MGRLSGYMRKTPMHKDSSGNFKLATWLQRIFCSIQFLLLSICASTVILLLMRHYPVQGDPDKDHEEYLERAMAKEENLTFFQLLQWKIFGREPPVIAPGPRLRHRKTTKPQKNISAVPP